MENELKNCATMNEIFAVVNKYYNLDEKLGIASKVVVTNGIKTVLNIVKAKKK